MSRGPTRVLIVDCQQENVAATREALALTIPNAQVSAVGSLAAFREAVAEEPPDVVVMDLVLPDGDTLTTLQAAPWAQRFPVVLLTGHHEAQTAVDALKAGASDFLVRSPEVLDYLPQAIVSAWRSWLLLQEHDLARQALRQSQRFASGTINALHAHVCVLDESGTIVLVNDSWCAFASANGGNLASCGEGVSYLAVCDGVSGPESAAAAAVASAIRAAIAGQSSDIAVEYPCHSPTTQRWFVARVSAFLANAGTFVVVSHEEITERRRAEELLRDSEQRYRTIFDQASDNVLVVELDADGTPLILDVNEATLATHGYSREQVIGQPISFLDPALTPEVLAQHARLVAEVGSASFITHHRHASGAIIDLDVKVTRIHLGDRILELAIERDVTERRRHEATLRASEQRFSLVFRASPLAMVMIRLTDDRLVDVNEAFERISGFTREQSIGRTSVELGLWPDPAVRDGLAKSIWQNGEVGTVEVDLRDRTGQERRMRLSGRVVELAGERLLLLLGEDVTESRRVEFEREHLLERVRGLTARLSALDEERRSALARELHDTVGQNMSAIALSLHIVQSQLHGDASRAVAARLDDAMTLLGQTIRQVRDVMAELRPHLLDDAGLVAALRWQAQSFSRRTGIGSSVVAADDFGHAAPATEIALFRIVQEALINVAKHAKASHATIRLGAAGRAFELVVEDDGVGFDPGLRAPGLGPATGWGLVGIRERVEAVGGSLVIESVPGRGSKLVVVVPG